MSNREEGERPSLDQIRQWPPTVPVRMAAQALGVHRSTVYLSINEGRFDVETTTVRKRLQVKTSSLVRFLDSPPPSQESEPEVS